MKEYILKVLDRQEDGFIVPNQVDFNECDINEFSQAIFARIRK